MSEERYCQCKPGCPVPYGYCHDGCGRKTTIAAKTNRKQGQIKGRPNLWYPGHQNKRKTSEYLVDPDTGCWIWQGGHDRNGYGQMNVDAKTRMRPTEASVRPFTTRMAHTIYFIEAKGPIPEGLELDHLCARRDCCNPQHLQAVTRTENIRRGRYTKLTAQDVREIRAAPKSYGYRIALARKYGVQVSAITDVLNGRTWGNLD